MPGSPNAAGWSCSGRDGLKGARPFLLKALQLFCRAQVHRALDGQFSATKASEAKSNPTASLANLQVVGMRLSSLSGVAHGRPRPQMHCDLPGARLNLCLNPLLFALLISRPTCRPHLLRFRRKGMDESSLPWQPANTLP